MSNKEVIEKLEKCFAKLEHEKLAKLAACLLIDINRIWTLNIECKEEREKLVERIQFNLSQLYEFVDRKDDPGVDIFSSMMFDEKGNA